MFVGLEGFGRRVPIRFLCRLASDLPEITRRFNQMLRHFLAIPRHTQLRVSLQLMSTLQLPSQPFSPARNPCQDFPDLLRFLDCVAVVSLGISWIMFPFTRKFRKWADPFRLSNLRFSS